MANSTTTDSAEAADYAILEKPPGGYRTYALSTQAYGAKWYKGRSGLGTATVGAGIGGIVGGPVGAAIGGAVGWLFGKLR